MTAVERCPRAEELVALLEPTPDDAAVDGIRRHSGECPQCRLELAQLQEGFAALGPPPAWSEPRRDEAAQQRIAAAVLPEILAALTDAPAARPLPAAPRWPLGRSVGVGGLAALAGVPAALLWLRHGYALQEPGRALALALLPAVVLPWLFTAVRPRGGPGAVLAALGLAAALMLSSLHGLDVGFLAGAGCLLLALSGCVLPAALVLGAAPRTAEGAAARGLLGVAVFSGGAALQRGLCGVAGLSHTLVFHLGPFLLAVALFTVLSKRAARPLASAAAPA